MRVNQTGNNPVQSAEASNAQKTSRAAAAKSKRGDQALAAGTADAGSANATISAKGKEFARAKEVAGEAPDIREAKIAELRRRIAEGRYETNAEKIADRMVDEHLSAGIG